MVLGIDRIGIRDELLKAGASLVISDFADVTEWSLDDAFPYPSDEWSLKFDVFEHARLMETLTTLGNGDFATRGAASECSTYEDVENNYPGTYITGAYNRVTSEILGRVVETEELVNFPNWTAITFRTEGCDWFNWQDSPYSVSNHYHQLNIHEGISTRTFRAVDCRGKSTMIHSARIVHMAKPHIACQKYTVVCEDWEGELQLKASILGNVRNKGALRYREFNSKHIDAIDAGEFDIDEKMKGTYLTVRTTESQIVVCEAATNAVFIGAERIEPVNTQTQFEEDCIHQVITVKVKPGSIISFEKTVAIFSNRDPGYSNPQRAAQHQIQQIHGLRFHQLFKSHKIRWMELWNRLDIKLGLETNPKKKQTPMQHISHSKLIDAFQSRHMYSISPEETQFVIRFHLFHLAQTYNRNSLGFDSSIPARGVLCLSLYQLD